MPPPRGGGNKVTAYSPEGDGPIDGPDGGGNYGPREEPRGGSGGTEINDYFQRRDEFDSYEPICLYIEPGTRPRQPESANLTGAIYINSISELIEEVDEEHKDVYRKPLNIKWELEADPDLDNINLPKNLTVKLYNSPEITSGSTYILMVRINNLTQDFTDYYLSRVQFLNKLYYTKQDTSKYYTDIKYIYPPLNSIRDYCRFWVKLTQEESNKSVQIPVYFSVQLGPTPQPPVG